jgi:hypothetical protein
LVFAERTFDQQITKASCSAINVKNRLCAPLVLGTESEGRQSH